MSNTLKPFPAEPDKLWPVDHLPACTAHPLGDRLNEQDLLYYFDGPLLFTCSQGGVTYLACASAEGELVVRYFVARVSDALVDDVKRDRVTIFDALNQPELWLVDTWLDNSIVEVRRLHGLDAAPVDARPARDVFLHVQG